jgi:quercetin dioxygenase-like cupin family protein
MRPLTGSAHAVIAGLPLAFVMICTAGTVQAQDPVKAAPKNFKVLLENERVRVLDFHSTPGEKIPMHSHPAYISYSISGSGKTKFTSQDGKVTERPANTGQATWHDAETHASEYSGSGAAHVLLIELKAQ